MKKLTKCRVRINGGRWMAYLMVIGACWVFLLYYDRKFSLAFLTALALAPLASMLATFIPAFSVFADVALSHDVADKGEDVQMALSVASGRRLPIPFLHIAFRHDWLLSSDDMAKHVVSASRAQPGVVEKQYRAAVWGTAAVGVSEIAIHDYLGFVRITYSELDGRSSMPSASVSIRPGMPESQRNDYLAYTMSAMASDDKDDGESVVRSFLAQPGYEHRPYVPGDPLNRINWKLSARLDRHMVREDEFLKARVLVLILDRVGIRLDAPQSSGKLPPCLRNESSKACWRCWIPWSSRR